MQLSKDCKELHNTITASVIGKITAVHNHTDKEGDNGPPISLSLIGRMTVKGTEVIARGRIKGKEMMTSFTGRSRQDLVNEIATGYTYVIVHTEKHPDREIRIQIT